MRSLVLSDLHSNDPALAAVMKKVQRKRLDRVICLGDFVGYGAQPNQVLDRMRQFRAEKLFCRGNHDRVASGADDGDGFNLVAREAAIWTREHLSGPNRRFLRSIVQGPIVAPDGIMICHGSPFDEDEYVFTDYHAAEILLTLNAPITFFGHTHLPVIFTLESPQALSIEYVRFGGTIRLDRAKKYLINPGSVGQPRDRNPMASFLLYDSVRYTVQFIRVPYDIEGARSAIVRAGLPRILGDRLLVGT